MREIDKVEIIRLQDNKMYGTVGILKVNGECFCVTLEPPDHLNKTNISSIPRGKYECKPYSSKRYPDVYQVLDVPKREKILFHVGNTNDDTNGCILLGQHFGSLSGRFAILQSKKTFDKFRDIIGRNNFELTINELYTTT